jgi:DUF971 family protein
MEKQPAVARTEAPMFPTEIRLDRDRTRLSVTWENGGTVAYPAALLRERARDARSVRIAVDDWAVPAPIGLTIVNVEAIGNYAIRLVFSDGHDRGIYPWAYLNEIAAADTSGREGYTNG